MRRLILWALNPLFLFLIAIIAAGVQTSLFASFPLHYFQPNLLLLLVLWCALQREFIEGGILVLFIAYIAEIHSSAPRGLLMTSSMGLFLVTRVLALYFNLPGIQKPFSMVLTSCFLFSSLNGFILKLMNVPTAYVEKALLPLFLGAVLTSLLSARAFYYLERLDWITYKHPKARQLLENDLYLSGEGL